MSMSAHEHRWEPPSVSVVPTRWPGTFVLTALWHCPECDGIKMAHGYKTPPTHRQTHQHRWNIHSVMAWVVDGGLRVALRVEFVCAKCRKQYAADRTELTLPEYTLDEELASTGSGIAVEQLRHLRARYAHGSA